MNWQETLLHVEDIHRFPRTYEELKAVLLKQAEPSFKAGQQEGRREVVEWIRDTRCFNPVVGGAVSIDFMPGEWEAKLKEWGIQEGQ